MVRPIQFRMPSKRPGGRLEEIMAAAVRLQKYISDSGITSRRKAEDMIVQGLVEVNGEVVRTLGTKVDPASDVVVVDGTTVDHSQVEKMYILLHKPRGCMTTVSDPEGRPTVMDFVKDIPLRIYPVGRLDYLSEGLLLMTNDGEVANMVMHPRHNVVKVYEVKVFGSVTEPLLKKLRAGVQTEDGFLKPKSVRVIKQLPTKTWLEFRLEEGKNREIRRLCEAVGLTVDKLKRVAIGLVTIDGIAPGKYRYVVKKELMRALGLDGKPQELPLEYFSGKKTVDLKKKGAKPGVSADDPIFTQFRRETYFETLKKIKEIKVIRAEQEKRAQFDKREEAHLERKTRKIERERRKEDNQKHVHAKFVK
jgi:23S rRNA pseudouridine2605 synthase